MALQLLRLARTLQPLKAVQFYARARNKLYRPRLTFAGTPDLRPPAGSWSQPVLRAPSLIGPDAFRFLNQAGQVLTPEQWNDAARDKLWLYNLHYFDDWNAQGACARYGWHRVLMDRWIAENPPCHGNGWEPYPTSIRLVNWIKYFLAGNEPQKNWLESLALQAQWLSLRPEYHLLGNHLLANAKALIFAGAYLRGPDADRWLRQGLRIEHDQLREQILPDGGHFERSPMYHALVLEDLLDLTNLSRHFGFSCHDWPERAEAMLGALALLTHPDGEISFFNDAAFGIAPAPADLIAYAAQLGIPVPGSKSHGLQSLPQTGYLRVARGDALVLIDAAPIGPDYLPGHAHADTLSFEMSLGDERIIVNGGTSVYGSGRQRQFERSTAAHSTVEIDGENSSEVWAGFRVGRKARVCDLETIADSDAVRVSAAHDGYRWLAGAPLHRRTWRLADRELMVSDAISAGRHRGVARYHLGPGLRASIGTDRTEGRLLTPKGRALSWRSSAPAVIAPSQWHPEFGKTEITEALVIDLADGILTFELGW